MTDRRLPAALHNELEFHRAEASRHRQVRALRRRQHAATLAMLDERLRAVVERVAGRRTAEVCCA